MGNIKKLIETNETTKKVSTNVFRAVSKSFMTFIDIPKIRLCLETYPFCREFIVTKAFPHSRFLILSSENFFIFHFSCHLWLIGPFHDCKLAWLTIPVSTCPQCCWSHAIVTFCTFLIAKASKIKNFKSVDSFTSLIRLLFTEISHFHYLLLSAFVNCRELIQTSDWTPYFFKFSLLHSSSLKSKED
jgi:hypothetical protein